MEVDLVIIKSRFNLFWFELVALFDGKVVKSYGQFRTVDEAEKFSREIKKEQ